MQLSLAFLGPLQISLGDQILPTSRARKIEALLAYLSVESDNPHPRSALDGLLFPEMPDVAARTNLRQTITRLRRAIGDQQASPPYLLIQAETLQFNTGSEYSLDVSLFRQKLQGCPEHAGRRDPGCPECMRLLQEALALYRGPFLDNFFLDDSESFETWLQTLRQEFSQAVIEACQALVAYYEQRGEYSLATAQTQRWISLAPWSEEAHRQQMRLLARMGQRSAALAQYETCRQSLENELGVDPSPETQALYERLRAGMELPPNQLPAPAGLFVGRSTEANTLRQYLADPQRRLITLLGPGGIGKTQLALHVSWELAEDYLGPFPDGVYFVELPAGGNARWLVNTLLQTLDVSGNSALPEKVLAEALKGKHCLLVLDNGEDLDEDGKLLIAHLLRQAVAVCILVTSRQKLKLTDEWVVELEGLPYPERIPQEKSLPFPLPPGPQTQEYAAVQLLLQRARQAEADLGWETLTFDEQNAVVEITRLTEGMPLALELAAAWVPAFPFRQIATEIRESLDLLSSEALDRSARHRCIRVVFEHSWERLLDPEQKMLIAFAAFAGTFSRRAAEAVGANLHLLLRLREKSLLQRGLAGAQYYALHPLLRQFTLEKASPDQIHLARECQARYYGKFLDEHRDDAHHLQMQEAFDEIQVELENIRAGWRWAIAQQDIGLLGQYMETVHHFYALRAWWYEGYDLFAEASSLIPPDAARRALSERDGLSKAGVYAGLLLRQATFSYERGDINEADELLARSLAIGRAVEDPAEIAMAYQKAGFIAHLRGDYEYACTLMNSSLDVAKEIGGQVLVGQLLMGLGAAARDQENYAEAQHYFQEGVQCYRGIGDSWGIANSLRLLGDTLGQTGRWSEAQPYLEESLLLCQQLGNAVMEALTWNTLGVMARAQGNSSQAMERFQRGLALAQQAKNERGQAHVLLNLADQAFSEGGVVEARGFLSTGFECAVRVQDVNLILRLLLQIARLAQREKATIDSRLRAEALAAVVFFHKSSAPGLKMQARQLLERGGLTLPAAAPKTFNEVCFLARQTLAAGVA